MNKNVFFVSLLLVFLAACGPNLSEQPSEQPEAVYIVQTPVPESDPSLTTVTPLPPTLLPATPTIDPILLQNMPSRVLPIDEVIRLNAGYPSTSGKCHTSYTADSIAAWYENGYSYGIRVVGSIKLDVMGSFLAVFSPAAEREEMGATMVGLSTDTAHLGCKDSTLESIFVYLYVPSDGVVELTYAYGTNILERGYYARVLGDNWVKLTKEQELQITPQ